MKILQVHNRYRIVGGEEVVVNAERSLLQSHGHEVAIWEVDNRELRGLRHHLGVGLGAVYAPRSKRILREHIERFLPDLVHVHNFFPVLSPSIYFACQVKQVPVVQTLHNYRLICPCALCFREGHPCEDCVGKVLAWPGIYHACYRQSRIASGMAAAMVTVHRLMNTWNRRITRYIALTEFSRSRFVEGGLPPEKIVVKPNFVGDTTTMGAGKGHYGLYVGRLSREKGLDVLYEAWRLLAGRLPLKVVGEGSMQCSEPVPAGVSFLGRKSHAEVFRLMQEATVLIFPSVWYETFGLSIIEAFSVGLPVIASNLGSMSCLVDHGRTGRHFQPGNAADLAAQVEHLIQHPAELAEMRKAARAEFEAKYTAEKNYEMLMNIYEDVIREANHRRPIRC